MHAWAVRLLFHRPDWRGAARYLSFPQVAPLRMVKIWNYRFVLGSVAPEDNPIIYTLGGEFHNYRLRPVRSCALCYTPTAALMAHVA